MLRKVYSKGITINETTLNSALKTQRHIVRQLDLVAKA